MNAVLDRSREVSSVCEDIGTEETFTCSACGASVEIEDGYGEPTITYRGLTERPRFCPVCGARVGGAPEGTRALSGALPMLLLREGGYPRAEEAVARILPDLTGGQRRACVRLLAGAFDLSPYDVAASIERRAER